MTTAVPIVKAQDFLTVADFSSEEILTVLNFASELKKQRKAGDSHPLLKGKAVAMYFEKPSNRTRISFEVGIVDLGAHPVVLKKEEVNLGIRESIADTARTFSRYVDGIMIRTFKQSDVEELAEAANVPVINGLTDEHHPCQIMADLLTIKETFGSFEGKKLTFVGDGSNNMVHSLMEGCALVGMDMSVATPDNYQPDANILANARKLAEATGSKIEITSDINNAVANASVVYTDVWTSMGQEAEKQQRLKDFDGFQVNEALMAKATSDAIVLHCLPAHRGEEITAETLEKHAGSIFEQAENRMHAQKAVMAALMAH